MREKCSRAANPSGGVTISDLLRYAELSPLTSTIVLNSMSDKLQFVDASMECGFAADDKLKFIGHKAPSPNRAPSKKAFVGDGVFPQMTHTRVRTER